MSPRSHRAEELNAFDVTECSGELRKFAKTATNLEQLAQAATELLFKKQQTKPGLNPACALVRFFRTVDFEQLESKLKTKVLAAHPDVRATDKFLTLLGTSGLEANWNDRRKSQGHQAIPLLSAEMVAQSPMIARLVSQLGIEISSLLTASSTQLKFKNPVDRDYNIFYIADAHNSPFIPSQEGFVKPHDIRSVIGYGSLLEDGHFYAVVMFYRVTVPERLTKIFTTLALSTTIAVLSIPTNDIFKNEAP